MNAMRRGAPVAVSATRAGEADADRDNDRKGGTTSETPAPRKNERRFAFDITTSFRWTGPNELAAFGALKIPY